MTRETISVLITRDELMTLLNLRQRFEEIAPPAEKDQLESFLNRAAAIHGYDDHLAAWDDELGEATLRRQAAEEAERQSQAVRDEAERQAQEKADETRLAAEQLPPHDGETDPVTDQGTTDLSQLGGEVKLPDGDGK